MMTILRWKAEQAVLEKYLGGRLVEFPINRVVGVPLYGQMMVRSNRGNVYMLQCNLDRFPESIPEVLIVRCKVRLKRCEPILEPLVDVHGAKMDQPSKPNHTLASTSGLTRICYGSSSDWWTPSKSIWLIYLRCRLWVEAYEASLASGDRDIDYYLNHA